MKHINYDSGHEWEEMESTVRGVRLVTFRELVQPPKTKPKRRPVKNNKQRRRR